MTPPPTAEPPRAPNAVERRVAGGEAVVLFDGVCSLCNGVVDLLLRLDRDGRLAFGSLQSDAAGAFFAAQGRRADALLDTVVLVDREGVHERSDAALRIAGRLGPPWSLLAALAAVPRPVRDRVYDWVAARRYRLFGTRDTCRLPTPEERDRFIEG